MWLRCGVGSPATPYVWVRLGTPHSNNSRADMDELVFVCMVNGRVSAQGYTDIFTLRISVLGIHVFPLPGTTSQARG